MNDLPLAQAGRCQQVLLLRVRKACQHYAAAGLPPVSLQRLVATAKEACFVQGSPHDHGLAHVHVSMDVEAGVQMWYLQTPVGSKLVLCTKRVEVQLSSMLEASLGHLNL